MRDGRERPGQAGGHTREHRREREARLGGGLQGRRGRGYGWCARAEVVQLVDGERGLVNLCLCVPVDGGTDVGIFCELLFGRAFVRSYGL